MAELPAAASSPLRARRWDAVVVGGALPGLVAAARLCLDGRRVLVVEEEAAARTFDPLREPFAMPGAGPTSDGIVGRVLRDLKIPLIEQRKLEARPLAWQVVLPDARLDVGVAARTAEELVGWGLAKPDTVQPLLRGLARAAAAEQDAMQASPVVRPGGLRRFSRSAPPALRHARGLPAEAADPPAALVPWMEAQVRALSNLASADPGPEARTRLLGSALEGGFSFPSSERTLRGLLRERIRGLHGEFRSLSGAFTLVAADGEPGVAPERSGDLWLGRALVLNAPRGLLARRLHEAEQPVPGLLEVPAPPRRRHVVHLRTRADVVPEGMGMRVIRLRDPARPADGTNVVSLAVHPVGASSDVVDVVATGIVDADDPDPGAREKEIESAVRGLMPFAGERLVRQAVAVPRWDDEHALADPPPGLAWPAEVEVRLASRPPVYELPRPGLAGLGVEGDVLLGWRTGGRISADLG